MPKQTKDLLLSIKAQGLITIGEAAKKTHRSRTTIYRWYKKGYVAGHEFGTQIFINISSICEKMGILMPPGLCKEWKEQQQAAKASANATASYVTRKRKKWTRKPKEEKMLLEVIGL